MYSCLTVDAIDFTTEEKEIIVSTFGGLLLYKSHKFEDSIKSFLIKRLDSVSSDLKR